MPPPVNRTNIVSEPGLIQFNGAYFYSKEAITITQKDEYFSLDSVMHGPLGERSSDRSFEIALRPIGEWESLGVLFPYFATLMGADIYGSTDLPLTVWTQSGRKYVFVNAAITTVPDTGVKVGDTLLGEMTFTALIGKDKYPNDANAYYTLTTGQTYPGDAALSKPAILTRHPLLSWNDSIDEESPTVWDSFATVDGASVKHALSLEPVKVNGLGTIGMRLKGYGITAQFQPAGAFEMSDILAATGANTALGADPTQNHLNISYSGFYFRIYAAALRQASFKFGTAAGDNLIQGLEARATRTFSTGVAVPLGYAGTSAPA